MAKAKRKKPAPIVIAEPTPEQQAQGAFARAGMAYRRVPPIVTLASTGALSQRQFHGLSRYRDVAVAADKSPLRSGLDFSPAGSGEGKAPFGIRINRELDWLEGELGQLADIARAVAVDDMTLEQWVSSRLGTIGLTQLEERNVRRAALQIAKLEISMAGERLVSAIGA
jgi:hypothetical protein